MDIMSMETLWFFLIAVLWAGYFVLEGFDFGVGILLRVVGKDHVERRAVVHTIERPRFEVPLPGYVSLLARLVDLLPQAVRDAALRRLVPNQVTATRGSSERRQYESHTVTGTEGQQ